MYLTDEELGYVVVSPARRARFCFPKQDATLYPDLDSVLNPALDPKVGVGSFRFNSHLAEALDFIDGFSSNTDVPTVTFSFSEPGTVQISASGLTTALESVVTVPITEVTGTLPLTISGMLRSWTKAARITDTMSFLNGPRMVIFRNTEASLYAGVGIVM